MISPPVLSSSDDDDDAASVMKAPYLNGQHLQLEFALENIYDI